MPGPDASRAKPLGLFLLHAVLLTALLGLWPTPRDVYPALFRSAANGIFAQLDAPHVRLLPGEDVPTDTLMIGAPAEGEPESWRSWFSLDRIGWWPSAALAACLFATPLGAFRRAGALALGLGVLQGLTFVRITTEVAYLQFEMAAGPGAPASSATHLLLRIGSEALTATIPSLALVLLCWVIVARPVQTIDLGGASRWLGATKRE